MTAESVTGRPGAAALWYAQTLGWKVFPCHSVTDGNCTCSDPKCDNQGKHPRTTHGVLNASADPAVVAEWWRRWPDASIALATGEPSGVDVLDVDPRHGGDDTLRTLELENGDLPETLISLTGGGGSHVFFKHTPGLSNSTSKLGAGLDWKTTGGYVILPPSNHLSGRQYIWEGASRPDEIGAAPIPETLLKLARGSNNGNGARHAKTLEARIPEGKRNATLTSIAGTMRRRGLSEAAIEAALLEENRTRCETPLPNDEVRRIAGSVSRYHPAPEGRPAATGAAAGAPNLLSFLFNDHGNAERLIALHGADLRYCHPFKKYLTWDGLRWAVDVTDQSRRLVKGTMLEFLRQAIETKNEPAEKFARQSLDAKRISSTLSMAECEIFVTPDQLDQHPYLLNFRNGTVDLRSGKLAAHQREHFITKLVHFDFIPGAPCPRFERFLARILSAALIQWLQKAMGYSLTGLTSEKAVFLCHGIGNNGKTTLLSLRTPAPTLRPATG